MKLLRFGKRGCEKPGVLMGESRLDVSEFGEDYNEAFFGADGVARLRKWLVRNGAACQLVAKEERVAPCVARPSKIVCVGLNYRQHALESGMEIPREPIIFFK